MSDTATAPVVETAATVATIEAGAAAVTPEVAEPAAAAEPAKELTPEEAAAAKVAEEAAAAKAAEEAAAQAAADRKARVDAAVKKAQARMRAEGRAQREAAELRQALAAERAERTRQANLVKQYESEDPIAALERRGMTPEQLAQTIIKRGTPEEKIALLEKRLDETNRQYQARLDEMTRMEQQRDFQIREHAATNYVVSTSEKNPSQHELLMARFGSEKAIAAEVLRVAKAAWEKSGGKHAYPADEVLAFLGEETQVLVDRLTKAKSGSAKSAGSTESKVAEKASQTGSRPAASATRTLTSGTASQSFALPPDLDKLPEAKQNELLAEYLRRMTGAGA